MPEERSEAASSALALDDEDDEAPRWKRALRIVSPLIVIAAGVGVVLLLKMTAPEPEQAEERFEGARVEVVTAERFDRRPEVHAQGHVQPARRAMLAPLVTGQVAWVNDELTEGGYFEEGDPLLRVDPTDYRLAVAAQRGQLAQAELALQRERSARTVAEETWALFDRSGIEATPGGQALARNVPQLETAEEQLEAARAQLEQAQENLGRTTLRAPYDAQVIEQSVDPGQQVGPQQPVATLIGTDRYHVITSVPVEALPSLSIPQAGTDARGSEARVVQTLRDREYVWDGWIDGMMPGVDARGGMARVIVVVPDPLGLDDEEPNEVPLLVDTFVDVVLIAEPLPEDVVQLPRAALRERDEVWLVSDDGRLDIREVDVAWRREDTVLIREGVTEGDRVVTNPLATPTDGMQVRVVEDADDAADEPVETAAR